MEEEKVIQPIFGSFQGTVKEIRCFYDEKNEVVENHYFMEVTDGESEVTFYVTPDTYYVDCNIKAGDEVIGYYRADQPMVLIYPPRFTIRVLAKADPERNIKADYFNQDLVSSDGLLKLNISKETFIINECGRPYCNDIAEKNLFVIYGVTTRSIPAMTTPSAVVVLSAD